VNKSLGSSSRVVRALLLPPPDSSDRRGAPLPLTDEAPVGPALTGLLNAAGPLAAGATLLLNVATAPELLPCPDGQPAAAVENAASCPNGSPVDTVDVAAGADCAGAGEVGPAEAAGRGASSNALHSVEGAWAASTVTPVPGGDAA
jgi:hypothetical protein